MSATALDTLPGLFEKAISPTLARALAEAAAGYDNLGDVYFVASYEFQPSGFYYMSQPYQDLKEAEEKAAGLGPDYAVFGPFETVEFVNPGQDVVQALSVTVGGGSAP